MSNLGKQVGRKEELSGHGRREQLRAHTGGQSSLCQWGKELFGFSGNLWKRTLGSGGWRRLSGRGESVVRRVQTG